MVTTRFAPSPTGALHLGHVYAASVAWERARRSGGRFLLRFEDIDSGRCHPEFAAAIEADLHWLGLDWDGPVRRQSEHLAAYRAVLQSLAARGLLYPCFCTRADISREIAAATAAPHGPDGAPLYPGTCRDLPEGVVQRRLAAGVQPVLRLHMQRALATLPAPLCFEEEGKGLQTCDPARFGDVVLARRDMPVSYHLCVTHDDAVQGVTLVTRGRDLLEATAVHRLLQALMGWPAPRYAHHALLRDGEGRRLAKRDRALTLRALRDAGVTPAELRATAWELAAADRQ